MKKYLFLIFVMFTGVCLQSQTFGGFKYQAVVRDASGNVNANATLQIEISIIQGAVDGINVFTENHQSESNAFGLVNLGIGSQNPIQFEQIDWSNGPYFIKISVDGEEFGTSQLLSVPFAMHAKTTESYAETDPVYEGSVAKNIGEQDIENWNNKLDTLIESDPVFMASPLRNITIVDINSWTNKLDAAAESDPIFASSIAKGISEQDTAYWNSKLDEFIERDPTFMAHPASGITADDITKWKALFIWYTNNSYNYLSTNSLAGHITAADTARWGGGGSFTETDPVFGSWNKSTGISITESQISNLDHFTNTDETDPVFAASIAKSITTVDTANWNHKLDGFTETDPVYGVSVAKGITSADTAMWNDKLNVEVDGSVTNEIQTLSLSNDTLYLANGGFVKLPSQALKDADEDTKIQVEESSDEDKIRFDIGGEERWVMRGRTLENSYNGGSLFIGQSAGINDNQAFGANVFIGRYAGKENTSGTYNSVVGYQALALNTSGASNTVFGGMAMYANTSGGSNTAIGTMVLRANTSGSLNTALGSNALYRNVDGSANCAIGSASLHENTSGNQNVAIGYNSLQLNSAGNENTAIGNYAGLNTTGSSNVFLGSSAGFKTLGSRNIFLGYRAGHYETGSDKLYIENSNSESPLIYGDFAVDTLRINGKLSIAQTIKIEGGSPGSGKVLTSDASGLASWENASNLGVTYKQSGDNFAGSLLLGHNTTGVLNFAQENTGVGFDALRSITSGDNNAAIGSHALYANTTGSQNLANGYYALYFNTTGNYNAANGSKALYQNKTGSNNSANGSYALFSNITGNNNTALGSHSGYYALGSNNVFLGSQAGHAETGSNKLYIENSNTSTPLIYGDFTNDSLRVNGTLDIKETLKIEGGNPAAGKVLTSDANGNASWETTDINGKANIVSSASLTLEPGKTYLYTETADLTLTFPEHGVNEGEIIKIYFADRTDVVYLKFICTSESVLSLASSDSSYNAEMLYGHPVWLDDDYVTFISDGNCWIGFGISVPPPPL